jgi:cytidylate kinase
MNVQIHDHPRILAAAERQMQAWTHAQETADRALQAALERRLGAAGRTYAAISREAGTGAADIARLLAQKLGWELLDRTMLDQIAQRLHKSRAAVEVVDETGGHWAFDAFGGWLDDQLVSHERYVAYLVRLIRAAGRRGKAVFVGRGAQFLLPPEKGLAVRLVAPEEYRVRQIMDRRSLPEDQARRFVRQTDQNRREFVQQFFHCDAADPHLYDLVLNVERLTPQGAVDQIAMALCR